ncbi:hypothetical protein Tco_0321033 [Tanacetum coccineum]
MSKRNLLTITCSLSQSDLVNFVDEYGISLCYDPKLPSFNATALDASKSHIPSYLSLFSIGNLRFPLNNFCLDVFEFFWCHFPLLNPFRVVCVTTFDFTCKAYGGEATVPIFRSLLTLGPAGDWLTFQKRPGSGIPAIFGDSMSNIPKWKSKFIFVKQTLISNIRPGLITDFRHGQGSFAYPYSMKPFYKVLRGLLCRHPFKAHTFPETILYLASLTDSWEHAPSIPSILIDGGGYEMAFRNFMKEPGQTPSFSMRPVNRPVDIGSPSVGHLTVAVDDDQVESSSYPRDKGVMGHELVVVGEGCFEQDVIAVRPSKKRRSITEALEEEATVVRPVSKKKKSKGSRRLCTRGSVPPLSVTAPKGADVEEAHAAHNMISGLHHPLLKDKLGFLTFDELVDVYDNDLVSLNSKKGFLEYEMSKLEGQLAKAQKNQDELLRLRRVAASSKESRKKLMEEVDGLQSRLKETECLGKRCQDLEHERDFLLKKSEEALDEVHGLGDSWDLKDVQDYHPEVEKIFDEATEAFYKLEFPYNSLLVENAGLSYEELASLEAPLVQEVPLP